MHWIDRILEQVLIDHVKISLDKFLQSIRQSRGYTIAMISPTIQVFGYHGTSREKANTILSEGFRISDNDYDWLGEGVYFFQDAPYRAMQWATQQHPQHPAVIRAVIQLDNCIDLLDIKWFPPLKIVYNSFREGYQRFERPLPKQNPTLSKAHRLDCAFFNYATELLRFSSHPDRG
jgi:hypothetical protein